MKFEMEVFRTGKHTDSAGTEREWTEQDLDKIVQKFEEKKQPAPLVIGHPTTDAPAYGWVENLKRVGNNLIAEGMFTVSEFAEMVKNKIFRHRSISLTPGLELRHIGFLGAAAPAVSGLKDVQFSAEEVQVYEFSEEESAGMTSHAAGTSPLAPLPKRGELNEDGAQQNLAASEPEGDKTVTPETQVQFTEEQFKELQLKFAASEQEKNALQMQIEGAYLKQRVLDLKTALLGAKLEGRLLPAQETAINDLIDALTKTETIQFSAKPEDAITVALKKLVASMPKQIEFTEVAKKTEQQEIKIAKTVSEAAEVIRNS